MNFEETVARFQAFVLTTDLERVLAEATAAGAKVPFKAPGAKWENTVNVEVAFTSAESLRAGLSEGAHGAISAALQGARAFSDAEGWFESAFALATSDGGSSVLRRSAINALAASKDDRALEFLLEALTKPRIQKTALARSIHPAAASRVRAAFDAAQVADAEAASETLAAGALEVLGLLDPAGTLDVLLRVVKDASKPRLRLAAVTALAANANPTAQSALESLWQEDENIARIAIKSALAKDAARAFDRGAALDPEVENERIALGDLLSLAAQEPTTLEREPRFVDLAARLRRDAWLSGVSLRILRALPLATAVSAIERNPIVEPPRGPVTLPARRDFLARYESGEHKAWDELVTEHAAAIATDAGLREETLAVARALMKRAKHNVDAVRAVMIASGARLAGNSIISPALIAKLESATGAPLPISLRALFEVAGGITLSPIDYQYGPCSLEVDGISLVACDPVEVGNASYIEYQIEAFEKQIAESHPEIVGPLFLELAPDYLHKQNISGGASYAVELPFTSDMHAISPFLLNERHRKSIVGYLRFAFEWGGFPILEVTTLAPENYENISPNYKLPFRKVDTSHTPLREAGERILKALKKDVIPF